MKRWLPRPLLIVSLCALLGCAPAIAPVPPLTMPVPDSPQEWRVVLAQWQTETVATYYIQRFYEVWVEDNVKTSLERHTVQLRGAGRTAQGHIRLRFVYDGEELVKFLGMTKDTRQR